MSQWRIIVPACVVADRNSRLLFLSVYWSAHSPPNPLGTLPTTSRCTMLPRRGTILGIARPRPVQTKAMCGRR